MSARRIVASTLGALVAFASIGHGVGDPRRTSEGLEIGHTIGAIARATHRPVR